jgi:hypothetical protein
MYGLFESPPSENQQISTGRYDNIRFFIDQRITCNMEWLSFVRDKEHGDDRFDRFAIYYPQVISICNYKTIHYR